MLGCLESQVIINVKRLGVNRVYKLVDTCAAEFKAKTPYYYSTFESDMETADGKQFAENESIVTIRKKLLF